MELLFHNQEECHRIEVYNEYLKKDSGAFKTIRNGRNHVSKSSVRTRNDARKRSD